MKGLIYDNYRKYINANDSIQNVNEISFLNFYILIFEKPNNYKLLIYIVTLIYHNYYKDEKRN